MTPREGSPNTPNADDFDSLITGQPKLNQTPPARTGYIEEEVIDEFGSALKIYSKDGINYVDAEGNTIDFADTEPEKSDEPSPFHQPPQKPQTTATASLNNKTETTSASKKSAGSQATSKTSQSATTPKSSVQTADNEAQSKVPQEEVIYERVTAPTQNDIDAKTTALPQIKLVDASKDYKEEPEKEEPQPVIVDEEFKKKNPFQEVVTTNKKKHSRKIMYAVLGVFIAAIAGLLWMFAPRLFKTDPYYADFSGPGQGEVNITIPQGATGSDIATILTENGVVKAQGSFLKAYDTDKDSSRINPGEYSFKKEMKSSEALDVMTGPIKNAGNTIAVSINPGFTQDQALQELAKKMSYNEDELKTMAKKPTDFGLPSEAQNLEGYLAPNLYTFDKDTKPKDAIQQMVDRQKKILTDAGVTDPSQQFKTLIMASLAEKEGNKTDYAHIVGILNNRMNPNNPQSYGALQLDSTVGYGLGDMHITTTDAQRADASNKYNTYANKGLPIGPIANPSKLAIDAALHPDTTDDFYWVTVNPDTGETKFSKDLDTHNTYVKEFQQWCGDNPQKCTAAQ